MNITNEDYNLQESKLELHWYRFLCSPVTTEQEDILDLTFVKPLMATYIPLVVFDNGFIVFYVTRRFS